MKYLPLLALLAFYQSCTTKAKPTPQAQADTLVKHYLDSVLNDPSSYQAVKSEFDTIYTKIESDSLVKLPPGDTEISSTDLDKDVDLYDERVANGYYDRLNEHRQKAIDSLSKTYKPRLQNYFVTHTYRAKNGFGALTLHRKGFAIDTGFTKIIGVFDRD